MSKVQYDYNSKVVLITGAGSGIGAAMAKGFAAAGASVAVIDIDEVAAARTVEGIKSAGGAAEAFVADLADEVATSEAVAKVIERFGSLSVAVNNAGIEAPLVPLAALEGDAWRRVSDVNLSAVFYGMKAQIPFMLAMGSGAILNTASISGIIGGYNLAAYTATKHGVIGLTKGAAVDYAAQGIRINALCPGLVDTPFIAALPQSIRDRLKFGIPMNRAGRAEEMAAAALWLCSDDASYVTGHAMVVDGAASLGAAGTRIDNLTS